MRTLLALVAVVLCGCNFGGHAPATYKRAAAPVAFAVPPPPMPPDAVVPPPPFYQTAVFFGCGQNMATDGNRHAFIFNTWVGLYAWIFTTETDGYAVELPGWSGHGCSTCALVGNTLVVADGGMRVSTFELSGTTAVLTSDFNFSGGGCPAITPTPGGGIFVVNYAHNTPENIHVAYRSPEGVWQTNAFSAGPWASVKPEYISVTPGPDDRIWMAVNRDSSHAIDIIRFNEGQLYDFHQELLNHTTPGGLAPNGEMPNVTMSRTPDRVLLAYQNQHQEWPCGDLYSYVAVCAIDTNMNYSLAGLSTNIVNEVFTWSPVFGRPDGFNLVTYELNRDTCQNGPYRLRGFNGAWSLYGQTWAGQNPNGIVWSTDGWGLWRWPDNVPRLVKFPLTTPQPVLSISRSENGVLISWSNGSAGDTLQVSEDLEQWFDIGTSNPVTVQADNPRQVFRVKTQK